MGSFNPCTFKGDEEGPVPGFALRRLPLGVVNHVHLRDVRSEDLDLGPRTAQVNQYPAQEGIRPDSDMCLAQLYLPPGV